MKLLFTYDEKSKKTIIFDSFDFKNNCFYCYKFNMNVLELYHILPIDNILSLDFKG